METKCDFVTALLAIGEGGVDFFASCLLHLDPHELKTCRLVNRAWDEFIRKEVWGRKKRRLLLKEKLVERWKNSDLAAEEFGHVTMALNPYLEPCGLHFLQRLPCLLRAPEWEGGGVLPYHWRVGEGLDARQS